MWKEEVNLAIKFYQNKKSVVIQLKFHMIMTTTHVTDNDGSSKPWFLLHKCIDGNFNFFVLFFEFIEQLYLCHWQYMFWMFFIFISFYSSTQHIPCIWWNTRFYQPTITSQFFNIFCKSIFVGLSRNHCPTSQFIICIYFQSEFSMFVHCFSWGSHHFFHLLCKMVFHIGRWSQCCLYYSACKTIIFFFSRFSKRF